VGAKTLPSLKRVLPPDFFDAPIPIRPFGFVWGKHPIDFSGARLYGIPVFMSKHEMVKAVIGRASRNGFYYFVTPVPPLNRTPEAGFDFLGGIIVVSLSVGVVLLMRLVLAN
jgi:hypothetical protein